MIVAMSRFRVLQQREQDVRQAFLNRPGLVDDQAGFLGLEVFQDHTDCALFYLLTRWSSVSDFQSWHSSQAHRASHGMMPKGLKLDSAFTELRILDRVEEERGQSPLEHFGDDWGALTKAHLAPSTTALGVIASPGGNILGATAGMDALLSSEPGKLTGQLLWRFLTAESAQELRCRVETGRRAANLRFLMTFVVAESSRRLLSCNLDVQPNAFALLCDPVSAAAPER
jgi:heme-degrading monooxygenase HmoA